MKLWYDGYRLNGVELYCPRSVIKAIDERTFGGYWTETETYEALAKYIAMNFDGLHDTLEELLADQPQTVDTRTFTNDMVTFANKDDILTLLIHLGYLGYESADKTVYIPNKEIADEFGFRFFKARDYLAVTFCNLFSSPGRTLHQSRKNK